MQTGVRKRYYRFHSSEQTKLHILWTQGAINAQRKKHFWVHTLDLYLFLCLSGAFSIGDGLSSVTGLGAMGGANSDLVQQQTPAPSLAPPSPFMATAPLTTTASTHVSRTRAHTFTFTCFSGMDTDANFYFSFCCFCSWTEPRASISN